MCIRDRIQTDILSPLKQGTKKECDCDSFTGRSPLSQNIKHYRRKLRSSFQVLQIIVLHVNNVSDIAGIVKNNVTLLTGIQCEKVGPPVLQY